MSGAPVVPVRGRIYWADVGYGRKPWLCVSNDARNRALDHFLAVRLSTTTGRPPLASIVRTSAADPLTGVVLCDDLVQLFRDEVDADGGALSPGTIAGVAAALRFALAL